MLVDPAMPAGTLRTMPQPTITVDEQLVLRPWRDDDDGADAATVRAAFAEPDIQRWHFRRMDSDDEARDWIAAWRHRWDEETDASWAIARAADDHAIGQVGLRTIVLIEAQAQLSYWVLPAARRAATAARAARAITAWAFETLGLYRVFLVHSTANEPSCRVAQRIAFPLEGTLRGHLRHADGFHDMHLHARLRHDPHDQ
jgi:RimJ/RimL family protein N-acetyltransferase